MIFLSLLLSCKKDVPDIYITGTVIDGKSKKPITNIEIKAICWKYGTSPDESYSIMETKITRTNNKGKYYIHFDKGSYIEIAAQLDKLNYLHKSVEINRRVNVIDFLLIENEN